MAPENMSEAWQQSVDRVVQQQADEIIKWRREFHQHPELSGEEFKTTKHLSDWVQLLGRKPTIMPSGRGLIVDFDFGSANTKAPASNRRIGYRADIDALPINDSKELEYSSRVPNVMHACGHDAHTAILIGSILTLIELEKQGELPWPVSMRGLFQPSEENCLGALEMLAADACEGLDALLGLHVDPSRDAGTIGYRFDELTAHFDELIFELRGEGGHGARPHLTTDPISAAATLITSVQVQITRRINAHYPIAISFGQIHGGSSPNVIPELVRLRGTMRTQKESVRDEMLEVLERIASSVADLYGVSIEFSLGTRGPAVQNNAELTELIRKTANDFLGTDNVVHIDEPSMGGEDFAFYGHKLKSLPTAMFRLGTHSPDGERHHLHTSTFDIDESSLLVGVKVMVGMMIGWSKPE